jgi:hypothetical protein
MYSELLGGLCADLEPLGLPPSRGELVVILLQRRRNRSRSSDRNRVLAENLAHELDHDRMLLRLCQALGIETSTALFASPLSERERLEGLLCEAGVEYWTLDDNRPVAGL